jgi:anthranilate synthase/aminodeoxychorismate synthase-like glutamine amidotransferase
VSPGPCTPSEAGISVALVRAAGEAGIPVLGVCLGHQAIGAAFGGDVVRADRLMHGKTTEVEHIGSGVFAGVPSPFTVMRYHSLVIHPDSVPRRSRSPPGPATGQPAGRSWGCGTAIFPVEGVQFHPESVGTPLGRTLLANFLKTAGLQVTSPEVASYSLHCSALRFVKSRSVIAAQLLTQAVRSVRVDRCKRSVSSRRRLASTRLIPQASPTARCRPLIVRVAERVSETGILDRVVVATDAPEVLAAVESAGFEAVLTAASHESGTDRVAEVAAMPAFRSTAAC